MLKNVLNSNFNKDVFFKILGKIGFLIIIIYVPFALALTYFPTSILNQNYGFSRFQKKMTGPGLEKKSFENIFFGNSVPMTNVRAHELESTLVLGGNLMTLIPNYYMFKRYLKNNPPPKNIYVNPQLGFIKEKSFWEAQKLDYMSYEDVMEVMKNSIMVKDWPTPEKNPLAYFLKASSINLKLIHSYLAELKSGVFEPRHKRQEIVIKSMKRHKGYVNYNSINRALMLRNLHKTPKKKMFMGKNGTLGDKVEINLPPIHEFYAKKFVELTDKHKINLVFLLYPLSPMKLKNISPRFKIEFKKYYSDLAKDFSHVYVWAYKGFYGRDKFVDISHLNAKGSIFFKKEIKSLFKEVQVKFN